MSENVGKQLPQKDLEGYPKNVTEWKNYLSAPETDFHVYENINLLREGVESPENWTKTKELAKKELESVPQTIIPQLFERLKPYLEELPGGHSKNHVYRDFINSLAINQDPWVKSLDDVEKFIGIMGGTFHDIGNSVVNRYEETKRFAGHAEAGAFLFGDIAKDLLSPNLLKLSQFAIAAHTHYAKDIPIPPKKVNGEEKTIVKKPYDDTLSNDGNKAGIWLSQWADRLDAQGVQAFIRHSITKAEPTEDYDPSQGFHQIKENEIKDFTYHLSPTMRTENFTGGRNTLEHITMYRNSALGKSVYSQHDTPYFTNELVRPNAEEQDEFVKEVLRETPILQDEEINKGLETFYAMCRRVDRGNNIETVIDLFKRKFTSLPKDQLSHWVNGFSVLPKLYDQMLSRIEIKLRDANNDRSQSGVFKEAGKLATQKLEELKKVS